MDPDPSFLFIHFLTIGSYEVATIVVHVLLLACSALISGSEVALFSLTPTDFEADETKQSPQQKILIRLLDRPKKLLATILVANNFVNIAIVLLFDSLFSSLEIVVFGINLRFIFEVVVVTFLILLFGEILPKIYANRNKITFSHTMAYPLSFLDKLLSVFSLPMRYITILIHERLGKQKSNLSVDQLSHALELTSEEDTTKEEQKILQGIVTFGNTETREVMKNRMDVFAINIQQPFKEVIAVIVEQGYSRIPVFEESIDNIKGVLYIKDLLPHLNKEEFNWQGLIREAYFIPENKKLDDLLNDFNEKKNHLAIVVDEYGGTSGIISLEDIIEEIVGDISDEFDDESLVYSKLDDNNYVFEGKTPIKDFYRVLNREEIDFIEDHRGDAETLAGFLLEMSGLFPRRGQKIVVENFTFVIEAVENKRIKQVKLTIA